MQRINANELASFITDGTINKATLQVQNAAVYRSLTLIRISGDTFFLIKFANHRNNTISTSRIFS